MEAKEHLQSSKIKIVIASLLVVCITLFVIVRLFVNQQNRLETLLNHNIETVKNLYNLTVDDLEKEAYAIVAFLRQDEKVLKILEQYQSASKTQKDLLREELYKYLQPYYKEIQKLGVFQFHFIDPNNRTILRLYKPQYYDDDLSKTRYSIAWANTKREKVVGLEGSKSAPGYKNIYPLFSKDGHYLGLVDIAYDLEYLAKKLDKQNHHIHFLVKKSLFDKIAWNKDEYQKKFRSSFENSSFVTLKEDSKFDQYDQKLEHFIEKNAQYIRQFMELNKEFAFYDWNPKTVVIASFIPLKCINGNIFAYLVSYNDSKVLLSFLNDYYLFLTLTLTLFILLLFLFYKLYSYYQIFQKHQIEYKILAEYDSLTKLPNRNLMHKKLHDIIAKNAQVPKNFALLFLDLDNFKVINDSHGHSEGDRVLIYIAKAIQRLLPSKSFMARFGGDEFIIILEDVMQKEEVESFLQKVFQTLSNPIDVGYATYFIGASVGVAFFPQDAKDEHELIRYADMAMYKAKERGRNQAVFFSKEMGLDLLKQVTLENEMRYGIENDEFVIFYQPQIDARENRLVSVEALVRWRHPTRGLIPPSEFIPIAERSQLIVKLDRYLMKKAMKQMKEWKARGYAIERVALNLSVKELHKEDFVEDLEFALKNSAVDASWIEVEITETLIMLETDNIVSKLQSLKKLGVEVAIDDFGTGYSSLVYLKRLPLNRLKIDKAFVDDMLVDSDSQVIVKTIINLAKSLGLEVLAEGVETQEQVDFLVKHGCYMIQGYYFSKPLEAKDLEQKFFTKDSSDSSS